MPSPFFSVITATYNAAATLPRLLDSLAAQSWREFELIIQDGASQDGTLAVIESYRERLPALSLLSEPDRGIYDAWNRALGRIKGRWVIFLGADDALLDAATLRQAAEKLALIPESVIFAAGDIILCDGEAELSVERGLDEKAPERLRAGEAATHSGLFQRARVFENSGFDTSYSIVGDHDFIIRHWRKASDGIRLNMAVTRMGIGGITSSLGSILPFRREFFRVMYRHYGLAGALPFAPGLIKGLLPYALFRLLGPEKSVCVYNKLRSIRGLPRAHVK